MFIAQIGFCQLEVGVKAPEIKLEYIHNDNNKFSGVLEEKITVIDFWATWCMPCIAGLPSFDTLFKNYSNKDVQFIAITEEPKEKFIGFIEHKKFSFPVGFDSDGSVFKDYKITSIPSSYIINRKGVVVFTGHHITKELLEEVIETDQIKIDHKKPVKQNPQVKKLELAEAVYGEDPIYNTVKKQYKLNNNIPNKISQLIIRPNLNTGTMLSSERKLKNGYVGITMYGFSVSTLYQDFYNIRSYAWLRNNTNDTLKYDIIYYKKAKSVKDAKQEIVEELETNLSYYLDSLEAMESVFELYLDEQSELLIVKSSLSESAQKACISVEFVLKYLEYFRGVIHLSDSSLKDIMINDPEKSYSYYRNSTPMEIETYLKEIGISIRLVDKKLTTYELNIR